MVGTGSKRTMQTCGSALTEGMMETVRNGKKIFPGADDVNHGVGFVLMPILIQ